MAAAPPKFDGLPASMTIQEILEMAQDVCAQKGHYSVNQIPYVKQLQHIAKALRIPITYKGSHLNPGQANRGADVDTRKSRRKTKRMLCTEIVAKIGGGGRLPVRVDNIPQFGQEYLSHVRTGGPNSPLQRDETGRFVTRPKRYEHQRQYSPKRREPYDILTSAQQVTNGSIVNQDVANPGLTQIAALLYQDPTGPIYLKGKHTRFMEKLRVNAIKREDGAEDMFRNIHTIARSFLNSSKCQVVPSDLVRFILDTTGANAQDFWTAFQVEPVPPNGDGSGFCRNQAYWRLLKKYGKRGPGILQAKFNKLMCVPGMFVNDQTSEEALRRLQQIAQLPRQ